MVGAKSFFIHIFLLFYLISEKQRIFQDKLQKVRMMEKNGFLFIHFIIIFIPINILFFIIHYLTQFYEIYIIKAIQFIYYMKFFILF